MNEKKVLLAEDDDGIIQVVTMILENEGYTVLTAENEKEVMQLLEKDLPGLVLLDVGLGGSNGGEIAKKIKHSEKTRDLPVLIVSANSETQEIATASGADGFLLKPFDIDILINTVKKYC